MIEISEIENVIREALAGAEVEVNNPHGDGLHFSAVVIAPQFVGKGLVEQHQMVMGTLKEHFESALHALSLKTYTPEEWNERNPGKN
ncbi:BolA family protein [Candidatus Neptunochlamydia vexilliferae]|uniref:BolA family transcriptional regulator n=1 Tax=Candidatus Neptunichlamydia vexilliferae TaxID=1651774 RepID=A0ABS0AZN6_9BACT|nr:BolA/IbaG family iron-sulfur metabolism protein [Candidatus Neptunochlamydia vexilliferae]MBF5059409.1 hypothetical protein [Candidatus Neptunochlamydia vexilliferae]